MEIIVRNSSNMSIYNQIYEQIKNLILSGELESGTMLPSIRFLAKDLKISVITTKRAYDKLESDGFIETVPGKGCFVSQKNLEFLKEHHLRKMEEYLEEAIRLSKCCDVSLENLIEITKELYEENKS